MPLIFLKLILANIYGTKTVYIYIQKVCLDFYKFKSPTLFFTVFYFGLCHKLLLGNGVQKSYIFVPTKLLTPSK